MKNLTEDQIKLITSKVIEIHAEQRESEEKKEKDRRLRNTKLLLRNYRSLKKYAEKEEAEATEDWEGIDLKELLVFGEDLVKSIKQTSQRTLVMIRHIDQGLATLRYIYEQENLTGTNRQYDILHARFVDGNTIVEIANEHDINERSVYKAIDSVSERLSIILFGVYGLKIK